VLLLRLLLPLLLQWQRWRLIAVRLLLLLPLL
jgi:hypothetical protein